MAKRGRRPKLPAVKILEGNPGNRPIPDTVEPGGDLVRPDYVTGYAAEVWDAVIGAMPDGVYSSTDAGTLAAYCLARNQHRIAAGYLEIEGHVIRPVIEITVTPRGVVTERRSRPMRNPWGVIMNEAAQRIANLGSQLGLDPVARMAIAVPKSPDRPKKFGDLVPIQGGRVG